MKTREKADSKVIKQELNLSQSDKQIFVRE